MSAAPGKFYQPIWSWEIEPAVEGHHHYWLPLVECPTCGESRTASGLAYPWIKAERLFDAKTLRRLRYERDVKDYAWQEFKAHSEILRRVIDAQYPITPGMNFGSFVGKLCGSPKDFVMPEHDLVLARRSVIEELTGKDLQ